ncbi:MAG: Crp/Fnr family transcriptional regulator [Clostridia bacterium]|nr:Crp/Fnr family transcriptional regulator [Clostridia bacterium]
MDIFSNITKEDLERMIKCMNGRRIKYKKNGIILSSFQNTDIIGIICSGSADLIRIDYNGNKAVIESLKEGNVFESNMFNMDNNELSIIALEQSEVLFLEYKNIINRCGNNCSCHNQFIDNLFKIVISKLNNNYKRIHLLTQKTIREKLLEYFKFLANQENSKRIRLPMNYTALAEYLSVDRSALMRELKYLKEDRVIAVLDNRYILLNTF